MGDMRQEFRDYREVADEARMVCMCGSQKAHKSHLVCGTCMDAIPAEVRDAFLTAARTRRGSNGYHVARRAVFREVEAVLAKRGKA